MSQIIKILGVGCNKYRKLLSNLQKAIEENHLSFEIEEIDDVQLFLEYGVSEVPSLILDGVILVRGGVPSAKELGNLLSRTDR